MLNASICRALNNVAAQGKEPSAGTGSLVAGSC